MAERYEWEAEKRRIAYAAERVAAHAERELRLLERATLTKDEECSRALQDEAETAYYDFVAMKEEHDLGR